MNDARTLPAAAAIVDENLRNMPIPDPAGARHFMSPQLRIRFTVGRALGDLAECAALNATRGHLVKKLIEPTEVLAGGTAEHSVVYSLGTPCGEWPDGVEFEGNRRADRYVVSRDLIEEMKVWNDGAEWLLVRQSGRA
jgi:hypothetical protein